MRKLFLIICLFIVSLASANYNPGGIKSPIVARFYLLYKLLWTTHTDFNKGTFTNTEVSGTGEAALVRPLAYADNSDDITFISSSAYTYDAAKVEIVDGIVKLLALSGSNKNWTLTLPADYTYDAGKIEVVAGVAKLKGFTNIYAHWHLNELSGTVAYDSSGNDRYGTLVNSPLWVVGKLNNCIQLNGSNQIINCGDIASFERTESFSVECWVKTTRTTAQCMISRMQWGSPYTGWRFMTAAGKVYVNLYGQAGGGVLQVNASPVVSDDNWHHVVMTYNGTSLASGVKIYIDSVNQALTISNDNLTTSIITTVPCAIGCRDNNSGERFLGLIDEIVVYYNKVLSAAEVAIRYNSGNGTEAGGVSIEHPTIIPNDGYIFATAVTTFIETADKPTNTELKYQISSDNGATWKWWNGANWIAITGAQSDTWYYTNESNLATVIGTNIVSLASSGTLKFRTFLHSSDGINTPSLNNIYSSAPSAFTIDPQEIVMNWDIQPVRNAGYISVTEISTKPVNTSILYQYSTDGGGTYNGSWLTKVNLEIALLDISTIGDGSDKLKFKFQLATTDGLQTPQLDNINILSDGGFYASGEYFTNIFDTSYYDMDWDIININKVEPSGTSIKVYIRASNSSSEMGSWGSEKIDGSDVELLGRYIQFKILFIGTIFARPLLNAVSIKYNSATGELAITP